MGTTLTGTTPQDTYDSLIKVTDNGPLSGTLKTLTDGLGNDSALALSTSAIKVTGSISGTNGFNGFAGATHNLLVDWSASSQFTTLTATDIFFGTNANERMRITSAGNVGIGTSSPLNATGYTSVSLNNATNGGIIDLQQNGTSVARFGNNGTTHTFIETRTATPLTISTNDTERMRITSGGNVGIGTDSPANGLDVAVGATASAGVKVSGNNSPRILITETSGNVNATFTNDGAGSYIGTISNHNFNLRHNNNVIATITSSGLTFNGDTAGANALNDYEIGTFTPAMAGATFTLTTALGYYTKIGRQVSIWIECEGTYLIPTGAFQVTSLPFTQAGGRAEGVFSAISGISFGGYCSAEIIGTAMFLESHASGTGANRTDMGSTFFNAAGFRFMVSATYFV